MVTTGPVNPDTYAVNVRSYLSDMNCFGSGLTLLAFS